MNSYKTENKIYECFLIPAIQKETLELIKIEKKKDHTFTKYLKGSSFM